MQAQRGRRAPAQQVWAASGHAVSALPNAQEWLAQHGEVRLPPDPQVLLQRQMSVFGRSRMDIRDIRAGQLPVCLLPGPARCAVVTCPSSPVPGRPLQECEEI